jgi:YHS domain-containing protein
MNRDLVCGVIVDRKNRAAITATQDGKTYYFCSMACREKFTKDPQYRSLETVWTFMDGEWVPHPEAVIRPRPAALAPEPGQSTREQDDPNHDHRQKYEPPWPRVW